ncbi:MAG TPA: hypothetical protein VMR43_03520, partial [Variovorax sp.]|nr:hypothetical protein [Variovorax sp.]
DASPIPFLLKDTGGTAGRACERLEAILKTNQFGSMQVGASFFFFGNVVPIRRQARLHCRRNGACALRQKSVLRNWHRKIQVLMGPSVLRSNAPSARAPSNPHEKSH